MTTDGRRLVSELIPDLVHRWNPFGPNDDIDSEDEIVSHLSSVRPNIHRLPWYVSWGFTILTASLVALTNYLMVQIRFELVHWKTRTVQDIHHRTGEVWPAALALGGISAWYALCSVLLVVFLAPGVAGSGIPEAKGFFNGSRMAGLFTAKAFVARTVGVVLSTASEFPIGREGPMVTIGGAIGYAVTHQLALPHMKRWVDMAQKEGAGCSSPALVVHQERFAYAKRIGAVLGASAGIATAFNAPIGGMLYMFEEVTVTNWAPELTFKVFVGSVVASLSSRLIMQFLPWGSPDEVHTLLIYSPNQKPQSLGWNLQDLPFILVLAIMVGFVAALMTRAFAFTWSMRQKLHKRFAAWAPWDKIFHVVSYAFLCGLIFGLVPAMFYCEKDKVGSGASSAGSAAAVGLAGFGSLGSAGSMGSSMAASSVGSALAAASGGSARSGRRLSASLEYVRYTCGEDEHNKVGTLLLAGAEGAVKHLFDREWTEAPEQLAVVLVVYFILACGMPGLPVPMGSFIPSMLVGALCGRLYGELLHQAIDQLNLPWILAPAGIYSMVGSAAMIGGFTQMSISIVALLVEATFDLTIVPVMMLSVCTAIGVASKINHEAYDEILVKRKGVPFLEADVPHELEHLGLRAKDLMLEIPKSTRLREAETIERVRQALDHDEEVLHFPVFDEEGCCLGLVTRARLQIAAEVFQESVVDNPGISLVEQTPSGKTCKTVASSSPSSPTCTSSPSSPRTRAGSWEVFSEVFASKAVIAAASLAYDSSEVVPGIKAVILRLSLNAPDSSAQPTLPLSRLMEPTPYMIGELMPVARFYPMFSNGIVDVAVVISRRGDFRGLLSRQELIHPENTSSTRSTTRTQFLDSKAMSTLVRVDKEPVHHHPDIVLPNPKSPGDDNGLRQRTSAQMTSAETQTEPMVIGDAKTIPLVAPPVHPVFRGSGSNQACAEVVFEASDMPSATSPWTAATVPQLQALDGPSWTSDMAEIRDDPLEIQMRRTELDIDMKDVATIRVQGVLFSKFGKELPEDHRVVVSQEKVTETDRGLHARPGMS